MFSKALTVFKDSGTIYTNCPGNSGQYFKAIYNNKGVYSMNKNDLVASVAEISGLTKADSSRAVDGVIQSITKSLKADKEVRLVGFGTFTVTHRPAGEGRNPRTGEKIKIRASKLPKFRAGKGLKEAIA